MYLLKLANLDSNLVIRLAPYFTNLLLVILNDLFIWKIGKKVVGVDATRFGILLIMTNQFQINHIPRCFTNSLEQILTVVSFHFYLR